MSKPSVDEIIERWDDLNRYPDTQNEEQGRVVAAFREMRTALSRCAKHHREYMIGGLSLPTEAVAILAKLDEPGE